MTKTVDNSSPNVGDNVVFTITVNNDGPSDATGIEVTDVLPNGYTYVSDDASGDYVAGTGVWTVGNIINASNAVLNITATVNVSGDYNNIAEVTAADNTDDDSTPGNGDINEDDMDSSSVTPNPVSDIEMAMTVDNPAPLVGDNVVFTIEILNNGPSDVTGVVVADLLPSGYTFVSDDASGDYNAVTGIWTVDPIIGSNSSTINITASVNATGDYENIAEVIASDNLDPDSTPNNGDITEDDQVSISYHASGSIRYRINYGCRQCNTLCRK